MRVLIVSPTLGLGGAERLSLQYAEGLGVRGHEVTIVFGNHSRWDEFLRERDIRAIRIADRLLAPGSLREWVPALRRVIRELAPDVVFAQSITASLAARAASPRCRLVTMLHGLPEKSGLPGLILRLARSRALAVSEQTASDIAGHRFAPPVEVVRSGVDVPALERAAQGPSVALPAGEPRFLAVARLSATKRIDLLIDAFAIVADAHPAAVLAIAGVVPRIEPRALDERLAQAERLGIADRVAFLGQVDPIAPLMRACDALVITSDSEGLPMALLESMALGVPAVARAVGGVPLVVHDGETGWLTDDGTPQAIARSMLAAVASPQERARRGAAGRELVLREYTAQRALDRIDALLCATARSPRAAAVPDGPA
jgi:glycosyltransferase involved in cell wall biosynthesis